jgi:hypothetical protein
LEVSLGSGLKELQKDFRLDAVELSDSVKITGMDGQMVSIYDT